MQEQILQKETFRGYPVLTKLKNRARVTGFEDMDVYIVMYGEHKCVSFDGPMFWYLPYLMQMSGNVKIIEPDNIWTNVDDIVGEIRSLRIK